MSRQKERPIISFNEPYVVGSEQKYIRQVFENGFFAGNGPFTQKVQRLLEERFSIPHVTQSRFTNMSALLLTTSILIFLIGLVSEQITNLLYSRKSE